MKSPNDTAALEQKVASLVDRIDSLLAKRRVHSDERIMIALAGVPGSGKSTISAALMASLHRNCPVPVALIPMRDGFHFPKKVLATFERPEFALRRRGAPFTFDAAALIENVRTLKTTPVTPAGGPDLGLRLPSFDHAVQDPVNDDIHVPSSAQVIIVEGNYLLLDEYPWNTITQLFDERWFIDVPLETARERLIKRHVLAGVEKTREDAAARVEENDIQNGELILARLLPPEVVINN